MQVFREKWDEKMIPIENNTLLFGDNMCLVSSSTQQLPSFNDEVNDYTNTWLENLSILPALIPSSESAITSPAFSEFNLTTPYPDLNPLTDNEQKGGAIETVNDRTFLSNYNFEDLSIDYSSEQDHTISTQSLNELADTIILPAERTEVNQGTTENILGLFNSSIESETQRTNTAMSGAGFTLDRLGFDVPKLTENQNLTYSTVQKGDYYPWTGNSINLLPFAVTSHEQNCFLNSFTASFSARYKDEHDDQELKYSNERRDTFSTKTKLCECPEKGIEKRHHSRIVKDAIELARMSSSKSKGINDSVAASRLRRSDSFHDSSLGFSELHKRRFINRQRSHTDASSLLIRESLSNLPLVPQRNLHSSGHLALYDFGGQAAIAPFKRERSDSFGSSTKDHDKESTRDEQNRQKSKRYYERKKAQNTATTALCTALDSWQAIFSTSSQTIELPDCSNTINEIKKSSPISASQRKKLYKIEQRNEETRQIRTIMSSAKRLEGLLKGTPSSEIAKIVVMHRQFTNKKNISTIEMYDHLSTLEAGLCIWLDHTHSWPHLILAEKRLADMDTGKPVQRLLSLLYSIS